MSDSELPSTENYNVMNLAIAWAIAKEGMRLGTYNNKEEYLDALIAAFLKAKEALTKV
jgi:hypothetical protein